MPQPPVPPRKRNAPIVVYPGSPPPPAGARPTARPTPPPTSGRGGGGGRQPQPSGGPPDPERRSGGKRAALIALAVVAVIAIAGGAFAVLSGGGDSGPEFKASTSVDLTAGEVQVVGLRLAPVELPAEVRDQMLSTIGTYVDGGIVKALRTGKADDAELAPIFDAAATAQLAGDARTIVYDEGLPKAVGKITITTPPVAFTGLADAEGAIVLVSANLDLKITARAEKGTVTVQRTGSFVFAPDPSGVWKITGWTFAVTRGGSALPTTTTAPADPTASSTPAGQ
jgi:hypothetical protein